MEEKIRDDAVLLAYVLETEQSIRDHNALVALDRVLSMAIENSRQDMYRTCAVLEISPDPMFWRPDDVKAWVTFTQRHYKLQIVPEEYFAMDGPALAALTEEQFIQRAPQSGSTLYAQLEIWKTARHEAWWILLSDPQQPPSTPTPVKHLPRMEFTVDVSDDYHITDL